MPRNKSYRQQTPPIDSKKIGGDLDQNRFDSLVNQKGYDVLLEKAITCPCRVSKAGSSQRSGCQNCGGSGWVFVNPVKTKMVLQAMNLDTQYKEWSEEKAGSVRITSRTVDRISFMDRVTIQGAVTEYSEIVTPIDSNNEKVGFTFYNIDDVEVLYLFEGQAQKLRVLENITDYTFSYNRIILSDQFADQDNLSLSVRYKHKPQFHVLDVARDIMNSPVKNKETGYQEEEQFPLHAIGRRAHYVLDALDYNGQGILSNNYDECIDELSKFVKTIQNSQSEDIVDSLTDSQKTEILTLLS